VGDDMYERGVPIFVIYKYKENNKQENDTQNDITGSIN
jgi:hypothetical protein